MLSNYFGRILCVAIDLHQGELAEKKNVEKLFILLQEDEKKWRKLDRIVLSRSLQQSLIQCSIEWLSLRSDLQILFSWNPDKNPSLNLGGSLFGALVLQLMLVISSVDSLVLCSSCGTPYLPSRKPNPNRKQYCSRCGKKVANRNAKRAERERAISKGQIKSN